MPVHVRRSELSIAIAMLLSPAAAGATVFVVDTTDDTVAVDGATSLREAIVSASTNSATGDVAAGDVDGDVIRFDATVFAPANSATVTVGALGTLAITDDVLVDGDTGGVSVTVSGADARRIFDVDTPERVEMTGLRLTSGDAGAGVGGALRVNAGGDVALDGLDVVVSNAASGAGIGVVDARVTISDSLVAANTATIAGGGVHASGDSTVTVLGSDVVSNHAGEEGGGLWNGSGRMDIGFSLVAGNTATAANAASDAQGGGGVFNDGGAVSIQSSTIASNTVTAASAGADDGGGGLFNDGRNHPGARIELSGTSGVFSNQALGTSLNGGGGLNIGNGNGAEIVITTGVQIISNQASRAGGALETNNGVLRIAGAVIAGNSAGVNGGAVHSTGADQVTISGTSLLGNTAGQEGGALWNSAGGTMAVSNATISGNTALIGNAANDAQGGGGAFNNGGTLRLHATTITGNTVQGPLGGADDGGGGVFNDGRNTGTALLEITGASVLGSNLALSTSLNGGGGLNIGGPGAAATLVLGPGVQVTSNAASRAGGGLESNNGVLVVDGAVVSGNSTGVNGGGIHLSAADQATISNAQISGNAAGQEGGGVWNSAAGTMSITDSTLSGNLAQIANAAGDAQGGGGAFNNGGVLTLHDSQVDGNVVSGGGAGADDGGGGIFNDGRNTGGARVELTGTTTLSNNQVLSTSLNGGGGLNLGAPGTATTTMVLSGQVQVIGNAAARAGGGLESNNGVLLLAGADVSGNSTGVNGGGVHVTAADQTTITGGTVSDNTAGQEGGGLWNSSAGTMVVTGATIHGNTALIANAAGDAQGGGGVFNNGGQVTLHDSWIVENVVSGANGGADDGGAGVFNDGRNTGGARLVLSGTTTLSDNQALSTSLNGGGGLNIGAFGTLTTELSVSGDVWIHDNHSARAGGGIESNNGVLTIDSAWLHGNSTGVNGGGVHVTGADMTTISNTTISGNTAGQEGGGLWNSATGNMVVIGSSVDANVALAGNSVDAQGGGGLFNNGGTLGLHDSHVGSNQVTGSLDSTDGGAGLFADGRNTDGSEVTVSGTRFEGNRVVHIGVGLGGRGGALLAIADNSNTLSVQVSGSTLTGNTAPQAGGAIELRSLDSDAFGMSHARLALASSTLDGNRTENNGGGLHQGGGGTTGTTAVASDTVFAGNSAGNEGGALWAGAADMLTLRHSQVLDNLAPNGGGVFVDAGSGAGAEVVIEQTVFARNNATTGGAVDMEAGSLAMRNSTVSGNAAVDGGGLALDPGVALELTFSTVASNVANGDGGGIRASGGTVGSAVIGNNVAGGAGNDIAGVLDTVAFTVISDTSDLSIVTAQANLLGVDPVLGPLADNGGGTLTHALLPGSPALDSADQMDCPQIDQRRGAREDGACDAGAFEAGAELVELFSDGFEG